MENVVLEIGTEEIPAHYMENALKNLNQLAQKYLEEARIKYKGIKVYGTPRRLILFIFHIKEKQEDIFQKIKGPAYSIAYNKDLQLQKPALKFAQSQGVNVEDLIVEDTEKGKYIFAHKSIIGQPTIEILSQIFPKIIKGMQFPKSMCWGERSLRFIRPIRWILALYGKEIVKFNLNGLDSENITYGHRLLAPKKIKISSTQEYFKKLEKNYVIVDPKIRENIVKTDIKQIIKEIGGEKIINKKQLKEIIYLVEYPNAILGKYDKKYLELPKDVLTVVMEKHQKYFPVFKNKDELLPLFIVIINNSKKHASKIREGNENVLRARLEDAKFFYQEDQKIPLEKRVDILKNVIFQENLGSLFDKTKRLELLCGYIADVLQVEQKVKKDLLRSAHLCKADLITEMVKEFPELQGIMGKKYAVLSGERKEVAEAIFEHYLPRFSGDILPRTKNGMILGIADKVDTIIGCFLIGLTPTGSQDPYGLRRQSRGKIVIILKNNLNISLKDIIQKSLSLYKTSVSLELQIDENKIVSQILNFLKQRVKNIFLEDGIRYDIIDAVLAVDSDGDLVDIKHRTKVIEEIYNQPIFRNILNSSNRVLNLSKNNEETEIDRSLLKEKAELNLYHNYKSIYPRIREFICNKEYNKVFKLLEDLCEPVDEFFDQVLVMDKDEDIRKNRIALIKKIGILFNQVADLSKIVSIKEGRK
ncbi:MAG TPA: glycine--tRNA ligase subunit beta [Candidatus Atribacteria bacterium]|nr:MAG: Glycine--tRNA ligase beta subunit [Atribacteria bacterium 34_128]HAJ32798.1 glycine--tRNA ligase subunit beta [Candidatus Atribacteria bacterium]